MKRSLILSMHPAPYRDPVLRLLVSNQDEEHQIDVVLLFGMDEGHAYQKNDPLDYHPLTLKKTWQFKGITWHKEIKTILKKQNYDVILIPGYAHVTTLYVWFKARKLKIPIVFSLDNIHDSRLKGFKAWRKKALTRFFVKRASTGFVPGHASKEFLEKHGMHSENVFEGAYCLDVERLMSYVPDAKKQAIDIRQKLNIPPNHHVFMYAGRFISIRDVLGLIKAFQLVKEHCPQTTLLLLGDGPESETLTNYVNDLQLPDVIFHDFVPITDIGAYYEAADVYVLNSIHEHYSLALVHAALHQVPLISTQDVGAIDDVLVEGVNGLTTKREQPQALAHTMQAVLDNLPLFKEGAVKVHPKILARDVPWATKELECALTKAIKNGS